MKFVHTADSHLGFEITSRAAGDIAGRRRRAQAIYCNFLQTIEHSRRIGAHLYIHSGDLLHHPRLPRPFLDHLVAPLIELARDGVQVLLVPGNHEKAGFPPDLFYGVPRLTVFDQMRVLCLTLGGNQVAVLGLPYLREDPQRNFLQLLLDSEYPSLAADINLLLAHQIFDQATVGPQDYIFGVHRRDTIARRTIPEDFDYVAAGHVHRYQELAHPRNPRLKIVYAGSVQRITYAEKDEPKGFVEGEVLGGRLETRFVPLPAYEMEQVELQAAGLSRAQLSALIESQAWRCDPWRVLRFQLVGGRERRDYADLDFEALRRSLPAALECQFAIRVGRRWVLK